MSIWMWILVAVGVLVGLLLLLGLFAMLREARDLKALNRAIEEGNTEDIASALKKWSEPIVLRAAEELVKLGDPIHVPAILDAYFSPVTKKRLRERLAQELFKLPAEHVAALLRERLDGDQKFLATELMKKLDDPIVQAEMAKLALAEELSAEQREKVTRLLRGADAERAVVKVPLPADFGKGSVAGKIIGGMLTGGVMAAASDRLALDGYVKLAELCALCGYLPGERERIARCNYKLGSSGWSVVGVNTQAEAFLTYKVCLKCSDLDEKANSVSISLENDAGENWRIHLGFLTSTAAKQFIELNTDLLAEPETLET